MNVRQRKYILAFLSIMGIILCIGIGSVYISPLESLEIISSKLTGAPTSIDSTKIGILWNMRLPRVLLAFIVGALLSVSGTVMQSVLKNPLASSYTLGVSSGAALGVALIIFIGIPINFLGFFTLPFVGAIFGILTAIFAVSFSAKIDKSMLNQTIILLGMIISLFINAIITLLYALSGDTLERMIRWQMGSFALKNWSSVYLLLPIAIIGIGILTFFSRELDNLTFGEDAACVVGIEVKKVKWILLLVSATITSCAVALVGIIGFIDFVAPHVTRKFFGSSHRHLLPMSALLGGLFMIIADAIARTIASPYELPIGAVTAMIGAPFFMSVYFKRRGK